MTPESMVQSMLSPHFYPDSTSQVELIQTHISWVFLTDTQVFKVKKPVNFGFLDFTTLDKRRQFCQREVELNSRLAPDTYLGVAELREKDGVLHLDGPGEVVEYAVKMRRLPRLRMLREVLSRGEGTPEMFESIARVLAAFHGKASTSPELRGIKGLEGVRFNCVENFQQTEKYIGRWVGDGAFNFIRAATDLFFERKHHLFERRVQEGRVVDGHGDLHLDAICVTDPIRIFDCIEFNERFRILDVAEEVAFLAMDLEYQGYDDFAKVFVDAYVKSTGDQQLLALLDFYKAYRAYVRAKIYSFQTDDPNIEAEKREAAGAIASRYYELAARYAAKFNPQRMLLMCGLTGTGKSTLARKIADVCALQLVSSDHTRKELSGIDPGERRWEAFNHGLYAPTITDRTYSVMITRAESLLSLGQSVILDGCFVKREQRAMAIELATRLGIPYLVLDCRAPEALIKARLDGRAEKGKSVSDGRWEIYRNQVKIYEPPDEVPGESLVVLDRSRPVEELFDILFEHLPKEWVDSKK